VCSGPSLAIAHSVTDPEAFAAVAASTDMFEKRARTLAAACAELGAEMNTLY
jgi:hypothetical protein